MTRWILPLVALFSLWTAPAWATITFGTSTSANSDGSATTIASPALAITAGQVIVVAVKWESNTTMTGCTDTAGNTYTLRTAQQHTTLEPSARMAYVLSATANAANVVTCTFSGGSLYRRVVVLVFNANSATMSFDVQSAASTEDDADVTPSSATISTTGTDEVCVALHADYTNQSFSAETIDGVARDGRVTISDVDVFYRILTATLTNKTASLTKSVARRWVQQLNCFKGVGGSAPTPPTVVTYYVAKTGSDSNTCTQAQSLSTPKLTITAGLACNQGGQVTAIRTGTYVENLNNIIPAGIAGFPTILQAYCASTCTSQSQYEVVTLRPASGRAILISGRSYITIRGLVIDVANGTTLDHNAVKIDTAGGVGSHFFTLEDSELKNTKATALLGDLSNFATIRRNYIHTIGATTNGHGIYTGGVSGATGWLIEDNIIDDTNLYGLHIYPNPTNMTIRGNIISRTNREGGINGAVILSGDGHLFERNIVYNTPGSLYALQVQYATPASQIIRHNIFSGSGSDVGIYFDPAITGSQFKNNIVVGYGTNVQNGGVAGLSVATNKTTGSITDCTVSTTNFTHKAASSCINAGTALSGVPFNTYTGKTAPDQGRYETAGFTSATITGNTMLVTLGMNIAAFNPVLPATGMTGWTVNNGRTVTAAVRATGADSVVSLTISGGACADAETWTVTYTPGNVTDTPGQPLTAFSAQPVTNVNCSGGAAPTAVFSHSASQFLDAFYATGTTNVVTLSAVNATNTDLHSGIPFTLATQIDCTIANCLPLGGRLYFSLTPLATGTPSAFAEVTNTLDANQIAFYGSTADPTVLSGATPATCLSGALTPLAGSTNQTRDAVPVFDLAQDACTVNRYVLQLGPSAVLGDIYLFKVVNQVGGALLDSYTPAGGAKLTVTPVAPISPPAGLHEVGASSNTIIELVWVPSDVANLAGYRIYQCTSTPCTIANWTRVGENTPARSMATHSPITTFRTTTGVACGCYFVVTAFDTGGQETAVSGELAVTRTGPVARTVRP